jgi:plastocyanin
VKKLSRFLLATTALAAVLVFAACSTANPGGSPGSSPTVPAGAVVLTANLNQFAPTNVTAPAGEAFQIWFTNLENVPHNVHVYDPAGASVVASEVFNGPAVQAVSVPALDPASYRLACDVHPEMNATLVAE